MLYMIKDEINACLQMLQVHKENFTKELRLYLALNI